MSKGLNCSISTFWTKSRPVEHNSYSVFSCYSSLTMSVDLKPLEHRNKMNPTPQEPRVSTVVEPATFHCPPCSRDFVNGQSLQMHIKNSNFHKRGKGNQRLYTRAFSGGNALSPGSSTEASSMPVRSHQNFVGESDAGPVLVTASTAPEIGRLRETRIRKFSALDHPGDSRSQVFGKTNTQARCIDMLMNRIASNPPVHDIGVSGDSNFSVIRKPILNDAPKAPYGNTSPLAVPFPDRQEALAALVRNCHPPEVLVERGYRLRPYTLEEINDSSKCMNCNGKSRICIHNQREVL